MSDRDSAFELGLDLSFYSRYGNLSFKGLGNVSDAHDGYELSITYDYPLKLNNWTFDFKLGSRYQSDKLINYYFGVEDNEVTPNRSAYQGGSAQILIAGINTNYQIIQRWKAVMNLNFDRLPAVSFRIGRDFKLIMICAYEIIGIGAFFKTLSRDSLHI